MRRAWLLAIALAVTSPPLVAHAESPSPEPSPTASPRPTPPATPSARPSPSATAAPSATPSATPSGTPEPSPSVAPAVDAVDVAVAEQMRRAIAATSLAERIDAQRRLAAAERDLLLREIDRIGSEQRAAAQREADLARTLAEKRAQLERLVEETYKASRVTTLEALLRRGSLLDALVHVDDLARLSAKHRETVEQLREGERRLADERAAMERQAADVVTLQASVAAKDAQLRKLRAWAERLVARGGASDAEITLLRDLADAVALEHAETERLIAEIARRAGEKLPSLDGWTWPLDGVVTQEFGPSTLVLEPPMTYRGVTYPHFHDGIDIAAALGSPVRAVARGRVAFVGHLPGGAMAVIVAHADGLISLYGHLDDAALRPPVRLGDTVEAGQTLGAVGLTGLTTGPHLHFSLRRITEPVDPRSVLPARSR